MFRTKQSRATLVLSVLTAVWFFALPLFGLLMKSNTGHSYWFIAWHWWAWTGLFAGAIVVAFALVSLAFGVAYIIDWVSEGERSDERRG